MADPEIIEVSGQFYQADLSFPPGGAIVVAGEPHGSVAVPVVTLEIQQGDESAHAFLTTADALLVWKCLGDAIANATGKPPSVEDIPDGALEPINIGVEATDTGGSAHGK